MALDYLQKEILEAPAWMWAAWVGVGVATSAAASYLQKNYGEIGKYVFWKVYPVFRGKSSKQEIKKIGELENKVENE